MDLYPIFISVVCVIRQQENNIEKIVTDTASVISSLVSDYELIIVDNASDDQSVSKLKGLTGENGLPNLQIYALTKEIDVDSASWVGCENALGDFVVVIDPLLDSIEFLQPMLEKSVTGADVVLAYNKQKPKQSWLYKCANGVFNRLYKWFNGIHLAKEAPQYRVLSKSVINFILQHSQPSLIYRHIPVTGGFSRVNMEYSAKPKVIQLKLLWGDIDRGMRMLVSSTQIPMRLVTILSMFGALANFVYSFYVILIYMVKNDIAAGWVSLSLQQSGMFFLFSLVLFVLGEYILQMTNISNKGPIYNLAQEFTSVRMTRREKLNVEDNSSEECQNQTIQKQVIS